MSRKRLRDQITSVVGSKESELINCTKLSFIAQDVTLQGSHLRRSKMNQALQKNHKFSKVTVITAGSLQMFLLDKIAGPLPVLVALMFRKQSFVRTLADVGEMKTQRTAICHAPELLCNSDSNYKKWGVYPPNYLMLCRQMKQV